MNIEVITNLILNKGIPVVLTLIIAFLTSKVSAYIANKYFMHFNKKNNDEEFQKRNNTLKSIATSVIDIFIGISAILFVLYILGVDIGPILAAAGVVGLAVGFGAQRFIEDIITGIIILTEDQIRVGDVVKIADKGGLVEKVDLKMVVLRDLSGNVHYIRNGKIDIVTNMTKDFSRFVFDIGIAYREDIDAVIKLIKQVDEELRSDNEFKPFILEPLEILGLDRFDDSAQIIRARIKTKPIKQWNVGREFNKRLKKKFDEHNVEIPFPHRTIYIGQDKEGSSPSLNININKDKPC